MGEYIQMPEGKVKLGTMIDLSYVSFGWLKRAVETGNATQDLHNQPPQEYLQERGKWRYRFPWPDEKGTGDDSDRGLVVEMPEDERCDCGSPTQKILMQKQVGGRLEVIAECDGCKKMYRWDADCAAKVVAMLRSTKGDDKFMLDVARFIELGYEGIYVAPNRTTGKIKKPYKGVSDATADS